MDDDVHENAHHIDDLSSDNRSIRNTASNLELRDSLTFKADGMLRTPHFDASNTPMSFGMNVLSTKKNENEEFE